MRIACCDLAPGPMGAAGPVARIGRWLPATVNRTMWDRISPAAAERIVVPYVFQSAGAAPHLAEAAMRDFLRLLPHWPEYPGRHILLDASDGASPYGFLQGAVLCKTSASLRWPEVIALPFMVPDPGLPVPLAAARHDVGFLGCIKTHPFRAGLATWARTWKGLSVAFETTDKPFYGGGGADDEAGRQRFQAHIASARFALCPRGRGMNSRRFFEALAAGRVPVLYSDAVALPLARCIDYDGFVVQVPEGAGRWTPDYLADFAARHDLAEASARARAAYAAWFAPDRFRVFLEAALEDMTR